MSSKNDTDVVPSMRPRKRRAKRVDTEVSEAAPSELMDTDDVGDSTQRNFRYQHAYGVILLIGAALKKLPYIAIWCEHHEDILAEREDGRWDGFQVKTRKPELGEWDLNDNELCSAIDHLARLESKFSGRISALHVTVPT